MSAATNISLARGAPSLDIIAVDELRAAAQRAFEHDPGGASPTARRPATRALLAWIAEKHGVEPEQVIATNGSMQADAFLFQELVEPGDLVVVEAPTYDRTLLSLRKLGAEILAIPLEADGIDVGALEAALEAGARPTLAHIIPNFQNPAGCTLSLEKRRRLLELARRATTSRSSRTTRTWSCASRASAPDDAVARREATTWSTRRRSRRRSAPASAWATWPGRPRRSARSASSATEHLHLAEHGVAGDRGRVLPLGRDRPLDRDREGRAARTPRRHLRRARRALPRCPLRTARGRLLPLGRPARGHRRGRPASRPPRSAAWCS